MEMFHTWAHVHAYTHTHTYTLFHGQKSQRFTIDITILKTKNNLDHIFEKYNLRV